MRRSFIPRFLHLLVLGCLVARQAVLWRRSSSSSSTLVSSQRNKSPQSERFPLPPPRISSATESSNGARSPSSKNAAAASAPLDLSADNHAAEVTSEGHHDTTLLPNTYDPPPSTVSFCVPWSVDTDEWWTHHPAWEVGHEDNDTHTCYKRRTPSEARTMTNLYNVQFFGNDRAKANCTYRRMWSDGFGSDLRNVLDGLLESHREGRPFSYDATPWHYAALQDGSNPVCATKTMACYFLPLGLCPLDRQLPKRSDLFHRPPPFGKHRTTVEYVLRPRQWLRRRVQSYGRQVRHQLLDQAAALRRNRTVPSSCTVVHVRRGDVILGGSHTSRRSYKPLSDYVRHIPATDATVLLLTDDANAIDETLLFPHITWIYFNRTRYRGSEGGWEEHLPSRNPATEMVALFSALDLVQQCNTLIHTASNFAQLLYYRMTTSNRRVRRVNLGK